MIVYELYLRNGEEGDNLIGTLPERRKNPERITEESVMNWGKEMIGDKEETDNIYYIKTEV